jgi:hypothetical protein
MEVNSMPEERPEAKRRLYDFDFSIEGAEISLVDKAANGHGFLVLKAEEELSPDEEVVIKNIDMLRSTLAQMFGLNQAQPAPVAPLHISNPLQQSMNGLLDFLGEYIRTKTDPQPVQDRIVGENPYQQQPQTTEYLTEKSENIDMPLEDIIKSEEGQKLINEMIEKAMSPLKQENEELKRSLGYFEKQEEERRSQEFVEVAKNLNQLGFTEEHSQLLKNLCDKAPEDYPSLVELLNKAVSIKSNEEMFTESGTSEESSSDLIEGIEKDVVAKAKELMNLDKNLTQPMAITEALNIKHRRV